MVTYTKAEWAERDRNALAALDQVNAYSKEQLRIIEDLRASRAAVISLQDLRMASQCDGWLEKAVGFIDSAIGKLA